MTEGNYKIPKEVSHVTETLEKAGFEAFLVGGCVRDMILDKKPKDWDVTTNATPEEIQGIFGDDSFYENDFGTVGVKNREAEDDTLKVVEITPYRLESAYKDHRHPDKVEFSDNLEDDLKRRDFTINAIAYSETRNELVDPHDGQKDLVNKVLKTVGDPNERFEEDALRIMRAIRLSSEHEFVIESDTAKAIEEKGSLLSKISKERIRDEFTKLVMSPNPMIGMAMFQKMALLSHISPILEDAVGVKQNKEAHKYDVFEHLIRSLQHSADKDYPLEVRIAALFHDISKPKTKRVERHGTTFYGHEVVGARVTKKILEDLKFSKEIIRKVTKLVRWHMFFADPDEITLTAVRRMIARVGEEMIWDLMNLRICDRIGTGRPKEQPYRFRKYKSMVEEALRDPISVGMLKINGDILINELKISAGPRIGHILHTLFDEVLDDPSKNTEEYLKGRVLELQSLELKELAELGKKGKARLEEEDANEVSEIRKKHHVE